jgi:2-C-methyl-D-erythritol 2,4-cyclodiphosphate synthase
MRVGMGYDVHKLVADRRLVLGGVTIPHRCGLLGHSDADVLVHAIMDALLGAAALGDIGKHFPDTDPRYRGISSLELLKCVNEQLLAAGYVIENIDATIIAQKPKLRPYIEEMEQNIAAVLSIAENKVNVKATTEEGLGFTGQEAGISAQAICLLTGFYEGSVIAGDPVKNCPGCKGI